MKMKRFIVFALLAAAFVGCENEKSNIPDWFTPTGEMVEIGFGEADTRVSLDYDNTADKDNLIWVVHLHHPMHSADDDDVPDANGGDDDNEANHPNSRHTNNQDHTSCYNTRTNASPRNS